MENSKKPLSTNTIVPFGASFASEITDPQGSYTGVPEDEYDQPVQDADDL